MPKVSAGLLIYRLVEDKYEVFLCHPGGPLFTHKDAGVWSLPKGEVQPNEDLLSAAIRECAEETDQHITGPFTPLTPVSTPAKIYHAWYVSADIDPATCSSNHFIMFGQSYPEIDAYIWCTLELAKTKIHPNQLPFITEFSQKILSPLDDS